MIAILLLAVIPTQEVITDTVDLVEVNHFFDDNAKPVFTQLIWYNWDGERFRVVAWRMSQGQRMRPVKSGCQWVARWRDGETERQVIALSFRETWTQFDPELREREWLPKEKRVGLSK